MAATCPASSKSSYVAARQQERDEGKPCKESRPRDLRTPWRWRGRRKRWQQANDKDGDRDDAEHHESERSGAFERPESPQVKDNECGEQDGDERSARGSTPGQRIHP